MEFVKKSVNADITDWGEWVDTYIYDRSELYQLFKTMSLHIPYNDYIGFKEIATPYKIWIEMLRDPNIIEKRSNKHDKYRYNIVLNDMIIAIVDIIDTNYKYVAMSHRCIGEILSHYISEVI